MMSRMFAIGNHICISRRNQLKAYRLRQGMVCFCVALL